MWPFCMWPINKREVSISAYTNFLLNNDLISLERSDNLKRLGLRTNIYSLRNVSFLGSAEFQTTHRFIGCLVNSFNLFAFVVLFYSFQFTSWLKDILTVNNWTKEFLRQTNSCCFDIFQWRSVESIYIIGVFVHSSYLPGLFFLGFLIF